MKKVLRFAIVAVLLAVFSAPAAKAQLRFGVKAGVCVNNLHFDESILDSDNRAGFTAGLMGEFTVPVIGVGGDVSAMYVRRSAKYMEGIDAANAKMDYLSVPVNLKWKIGIPAVSKIITPYIMTGPEFSFLCSKKAVTAAIEGKSFDMSWNFGFGVELVNHLQVSASYGLGLTKAVETFTAVEGAGIPGKNRYWTITAAYLF